MTFWQRAIAIAVLMVFTPASVLAGTPLRLCVGDDGHRAIEFVIAPDHHGVSEEIGRADCDAVGFDNAVPLTECTDSPLLTVAQKPSPSASTKSIFPPADLPLAALLSGSPRTPAFFDALRAKIDPTAIVLRDTQLDAIRTVVLLI